MQDSNFNRKVVETLEKIYLVIEETTRQRAKSALVVESLNGIRKDIDNLEEMLEQPETHAITLDGREIAESVGTLSKSELAELYHSGRTVDVSTLTPDAED